MALAVTEIRNPHNDGRASGLGIRCIGAARFESTDLDASEAFLTQALGIQKVFRGIGPAGKEEVICRLPTGQLLVVEKVEALSGRMGQPWRGPHTAFHIDPNAYHTVDARVMAHQHLTRDISHGEKYNQAVDCLYVRDPFGHQFQISSYDEDTAEEVPVKALHGPALREAGKEF